MSDYIGTLAKHYELPLWVASEPWPDQLFMDNIGHLNAVGRQRFAAEISAWAERHKGIVFSALTVLLTAVLFIIRELDTLVWVGGAYFTLRHIHVLSEWRMGKFPAPLLVDYLRYQFFLPVIMAGPIHRLPNFERQCRRRRVTPTQFFSGAERVLIGFASSVVLASWAVQRLAAAAGSAVIDQPDFIRHWVEGAFDWLLIYFSFTGLSAIAIGLALMCGLVPEENFRRPWDALNLIDFWSRWHMTLSNACRDYVFRPVSAVSRNALLGLVAAMLAKLLSWMSVPLWLTLTKPTVLLILNGVSS